MHILSLKVLFFKEYSKIDPPFSLLNRVVPNIEESETIKLNGWALIESNSQIVLYPFPFSSIR